MMIIIFISVTKFIRIGIADKNDNPPYFDKALYEAEVDENEDIQHTVLTVTAKDLDECKFITIFTSMLSLFLPSLQKKEKCDFYYQLTLVTQCEKIIISSYREILSNRPSYRFYDVLPTHDMVSVSYKY